MPRRHSPHDRQSELRIPDIHPPVSRRKNAVQSKLSASIRKHGDVLFLARAGRRHLRRSRRQGAGARGAPRTTANAVPRNSMVSQLAACSAVNCGNRDRPSRRVHSLPRYARPGPNRVPSTPAPSQFTAPTERGAPSVGRKRNVTVSRNGSLKSCGSEILCRKLSDGGPSSTLARTGKCTQQRVLRPLCGICRSSAGVLHTQAVAGIACV
jgi:hypothetical protein